VSKHWSTLQHQVGILRDQFLPDPFDPLGSYTDPQRVQAYTRAFLVLSHAEIETYLEESAKQVAKAAERVWKSSKRVTSPLAFLMSMSGKPVPQTTSLTPKNAKDSHQRFEAVVVTVFPAYYKRVNDNNGIKEHSVLKLFDPLGVPAAAFASTLLPDLSTLGALRGEHAHYSAKAVPSVLDPEVEYKRVAQVVADLRGLDQWLMNYRKSIR
jgi:hypothetical protein